jgi:hypothetical protein
MSSPSPLRTLAGLAVVAGAGSAAAQVCNTAGPPLHLPEIARESSGLALGRERPGLLWTHNDRGNEPELYAVDAEGRLAQTVRLAEAAVDWEDIEIAACPGGNCLYIGDIGDNDALRDHITIYRLPEPVEGLREAVDVVALRARYPEGPRDAESLFVLPSGDIFIVTKGRDTAITLYRLPVPHSLDSIATLERVSELFPQPAHGDDRVSAATASRDGNRVGVRSYRRLYFYDTASLVSGTVVEPTVIDLAALGEGQGEGLALGDDGTVWLSSEAANRRSLPVLNRLACEA